MGLRLVAGQRPEPDVDGPQAVEHGAADGARGSGDQYGAGVGHDVHLRVWSVRAVIRPRASSGDGRDVGTRVYAAWRLGTPPSVRFTFSSEKNSAIAVVPAIMPRKRSVCSWLPRSASNSA